MKISTKHQHKVPQEVLDVYKPIIDAEMAVLIDRLDQFLETRLQAELNELKEDIDFLKSRSNLLNN